MGMSGFFKIYLNILGIQTVLDVFLLIIKIFIHVMAKKNVRFTLFFPAFKFTCIKI